MKFKIFYTLFLGLLCSCTLWSQTLETIKQQFDNREDSTVIQSCNAVLEVDQDNDQVLYYKGRSLIRSQKYDEAANVLTKSIKLKPDFADAYFQRSFAYLVNGNPIESIIDDMNKAIELAPENVDYKVHLAGLHFKLGDFDKSMQLYDVAIQNNPSDFQVLGQRASLKKLMEDNPGALADNKKAVYLLDSLLKSEPKNLDYLFNKGYILSEMDEAKQSVQTFDQMLLVDSLNIRALSFRAIVKQEMSDYEGSLSDFEKSLEVNPADYRMRNNYGYSLIQLERYDEALKVCNAVILQNESYPYAYSNRAFIYLQKGNLEEATSNITLANLLKGNDPYILKNRALIALAKNEIEWACEDLYLAEQLSFAKNIKNEVKALILKNCR